MKEVAAFARIVAIVNVDNLDIFINNRNNNPKDKCKYFKCHDLDNILFDCRTCYCPMYNICFEKTQQNKKIVFGGYLLPNNILACEKCSFIHRYNIVEYIYNELDKTKTLYDIYYQLERIFLKERNDYKNGKN